MNYGQLPIIQAMHQKMSYLGQRQAVLAQNIANADTPDYIAQDVKEPNFAQHLQQASGSIKLATTDPSHLRSTRSSGSMNIIERDHDSERNPNGNRVSVEEEVQRAAMNQMDYMQTSMVYRKTIEMFRTAIGRPGG